MLLPPLCHHGTDNGYCRRFLALGLHAGFVIFSFSVSPVSGEGTPRRGGDWVAFVLVVGGWVSAHVRKRMGGTLIVPFDGGGSPRCGPEKNRSMGGGGGRARVCRPGCDPGPRDPATPPILLGRFRPVLRVSSSPTEYLLA